MKDKQISCSECGTIGIYSKGLCKRCYRKYHRKTPEGKLTTKRYNDGKGVEARQRFLAKKPPKPPKIITNCECGKEAIVKGLCYICYQKYYQRKKFGYKQRIKKVDYNYVANLVNNGFTVQNACKYAKIDSSLFQKVANKINIS